MRVSVVSVLLLLAVGAAPSAAQGPASAAPGQATALPGPSKSVVTARILGIAPGLGHAYADETIRALAFALGTGALFWVNSTPEVAVCPNNRAPDPFGPPDCAWAIAPVVGVALVGLIAWSSYDAGLAAKRWNERHGRAGTAIVVPTVAPSRGTGDRTRIRVGLMVAIR